ncbi:Pre-mRNA-splicing factor ISY1 [Scheffersomyces xylosifermentans]|uniref:Pre-mRNA-splicing factor ISY1 n=1 Tax=Scheffersomyces xylosifermentans TaxID=1304137 RepID=UPI00315DA690
MSRNKEKAQSALNRFQALKNKEAGVLENNPNLRPKYVQSVESLPQAEKWRSVIIGEISSRLTRIQDTNLNDFQIRDLNDELNKLFNEKRAWEYHIKSLGGNDYIKFGKDLNSTGVFVNLPESSGTQVRGYRYFGRAKELPDVKQALELQQKQRATIRANKKGVNIEVQKLKELEKRVDLEYYGFYDEKSIAPVILTEEEKNRIQEVAEILGETDVMDGLQNYTTPRENETNDPLLDYESSVSKTLFKNLKNEKKPQQNEDDMILDFESVVPSNEEVNLWLVERKKKELLAKLGMK